MITTTSFKVDSDNIDLVSELSRNRELSRILNFLLRSYKEDKGFVDSRTKIDQLERKRKNKDEQYEALKKEISGV